MLSAGYQALFGIIGIDRVDSTSRKASTINISDSLNTKIQILTLNQQSINTLERIDRTNETSAQTTKCLKLNLI